jgi:predicted AAA+ superfamily ATPase
MISNISIFNPQWLGQSFITPVETRLVFSEILQKIETGLITFLIGPRRVGKSTLLKQVLNYIVEIQKIEPSQTFFYEFEPNQSRDYLDLAIKEYFETRADKSKPFYLLLDEVQFIPDYELSLKYLVDIYPQARILITGSLSLGYKRKMVESLAGRILPIQIYPLCFEEYLKLSKASEYKLFEQTKNQVENWSQAALELNPKFQQFLKSGTYPQAIFWPQNLPLKDFLDTIVNQSLNQDATKFFNLERADLILGLYQFIAQNNGSEISISTISSKLQSNSITVKKYLDALELLGLIYIIKNTSDPLKSPNSKAKVYVNSIFENSWANTTHDNLGYSVESYVLERLLNQNHKITFFRERNNEIDFIDHTNREFIEVKYRSNTSQENYNYLILQSTKLKYKAKIVSLSQIEVNDHNYNEIKVIPACFL